MKPGTGVCVEVRYNQKPEPSEGIIQATGLSQRKFILTYVEEFPFGPRHKP